MWRLAGTTACGALCHATQPGTAPASVPFLLLPCGKDTSIASYSMVRCFGFVATALVALAASSSADAAAFDLTTSLATKTPYWDQSQDPLGPSPYVKQLSKDEEAQYTLVQVQNVVRHGTRFPSKGNAGEIEDLLKKLQTTYGDVIPAWLKSYKLPYNSSIDGLLAPRGAEEGRLFGARTRERVGAALPASFSPEKFILQNTYKPRTKDTGVAFASAFFTNPSNVTYTEYKKDADPLLRFFDECPRYTRDIDENDDAKIEMTKFKASPAFQKTFDILRTALNLPKDAELSETDIESAYTACAFDIAMFQNPNNWCTLLNEEFVKACDFADDLDTFVVSAGGAKLSYEISSVLLKDIYKFMKDFTQQKTQVVGNFRFVHGETTTPLLTLMGYTDKTPLLASFTPAQIEARPFRGSRVALFMANVEFRLYTKNKATNGCESADEPQPTQYFVQIRVNEQVTAVPGCDGKIFCELAQVEKLWDYYLNTYDWIADCKI